MLVEFLDWWVGQLRELVPERLLGRDTAADGLVVDASQPGAWTVLRRRGGVQTRVAQLRQEDGEGLALRAALGGWPRGEALRLRVPPALVLERAVSLPLAAERDLGRVLGYEMERLTPFDASQVYWDYTVQSRDRARGKLALRLTMVPRAAVEELVTALRQYGEAPSALEAVLPDGMRVLSLGKDALAAKRSGPSTRSLAVAAAGLGALVLVSPFLRQSLELAALQDRQALLAPRIDQVNVLRRRIAGAGAGGDAVAAETRRLGDTLGALAALTDILPDDSYLTEFTMRERHITLSGLAASAPRLISRLSADPRIGNPAFTAPVTRSETNHNDVFSIRADLAQ